jgi:hypothetical protein
MPDFTLQEHGHMHTVWRIDRFNDPDGAVSWFAAKRHVTAKHLIEMFPRHYLGYSVYKGNVMLNTGINSIFWPLVIGSGGTALSQANTFIGVGTSSASSGDATQTGLLANPVFAAVTSLSGPTAQVVSWVASFGSLIANQAWNEICVANANTNASGTVLNRLVQAMGTKASPAVWVVTLNITQQ